MPLPCFRKLFKSSASSTPSPPPPYEEHTQEGGTLPSQTSNIKASDVPQWKWSNFQCRQWLIAVFITYLSYSEADAFAAAKKFDGFGPNIYSKPFDSWQELYGLNAGSGIYNLVIAVRREESAVPNSMHFKHWKGK